MLPFLRQIFSPVVFSVLVRGLSAVNSSRGKEFILSPLKEFIRLKREKNQTFSQNMLPFLRQIFSPVVFSVLVRGLSAVNSSRGKKFILPLKEFIRLRPTYSLKYWV